MSNLSDVRDLMQNLRERIEEGHEVDWEDYTREERYLLWDVETLLDYIAELEQNTQQGDK